MEEKEKSGPAGWLLLALTAVFLAALTVFFLHRFPAAKESFRVSVQYRAGEETVPPRRLVDINTAPAEELERLTGIGPALAQEIVGYREEHGPFRTAEELMNVRGIGEKTFRSLQHEITTGEGT